MKAHLVQLDIRWEDREANFARVEQLLAASDVGAGDLVLLPEMFDSGFSMNTEATHDNAGATRRFIEELAGDLGCFVQGGRTLRTCGNCLAQNVATVYGPAGEPICEYQKVHPFSFGLESDHFAGGRHVVTYRAGDASICPAICYDLRFPELFRYGAMRGAEVFALGANWPAPRHHHWRLLSIARAIENQAIVLSCNRCGSDPFLPYRGGSIAIDHMGEVLGELGEDEGVLSVELDLVSLREWRAKFPALPDIRLITPKQAETPAD